MNRLNVLSAGRALDLKQADMGDHALMVELTLPKYNYIIHPVKWDPLVLICSDTLKTLRVASYSNYIVRGFYLGSL